MNRIFRYLALPPLLLFVSATVAHAENYLQRPSVRAYLDEVALETGLDRDRLGGLFSRLSPDQAIIDAISRPAERTLTWLEYRPIFLTPKRIEQGRGFLQENKALLERATEVYGVPASIITAIIGVETFYGRITGKHSVLESLATLAFDYPPRASFFRRELTEFLVLSDAEGWEPAQRLGSYAGAMGMPQFISSSYRQYAVDFDGDGHRDLFNSVADVIGSVANYLAVHGWIPGSPIAERWSLSVPTPSSISALVSESLKPAVPGSAVARLGFAGAGLASGTIDDEPVSVIRLKTGSSEEIWIGYRNFYAITRYNHSHLYAMAVTQLAEAFDAENP